MEPKYPNIHVQLSGEDGNAFFIISRVTKALWNNDVDLNDIELYRNEAMSGDYDNVLRTTMSWVSVS